VDDRSIPVTNEELRTVRDAMREMLALLDMLDDETLHKVVLTHRGQMRAVLVSVEEYARLLREIRAQNANEPAI
jgi:hypothetical protein